MPEISYELSRILLKADGKSTKEISQIVGYGLLAVYNCVKRFEQSGVEGLREKVDEVQSL